MVVETQEIGDPPVFNSELQCLLVAFGVDDVLSETAFGDKILCVADLAFFEQVLLFPDFTQVEIREHRVNFFFIEADESADMFDKAQVHLCLVYTNIKNL